LQYIAALMASTPTERATGGPATPPRTYAVGDLHGRLDLLRLVVDAIADHVRGAPFRVVFLGDYVDRGPDSRGVVEFLMALQKRWPVTCLKGNHEELMAQALTHPDGGRLEHWLANGGGATLRSYGVEPDGDLEEGVPREHIRWMSGLPRTTGDGHRIYVHAGVAPGVPIERQKDETLLWIRERFLQARAGSFDAHIVHGHTPVWDGKPDPARPELLEHRTNLDTGAFATGVLAIAVFDAETSGGPVEMIWVRGEPHGSLALTPEDDEPSGDAPGRRWRWRWRFGGWFGRRS
jgi:serine/threonine protein phosphatase 1